MQNMDTVKILGSPLAGMLVSEISVQSFSIFLHILRGWQEKWRKTLIQAILTAAPGTSESVGH